MFEKRYKQGEDNYVVRDRFICVTDGVGGWIRKLVDTGLFTKEYVVHMADLYDKGEYTSLKDLLDNASKMTKAMGSSTCVMAELTSDDPLTLKTCNLGDSAYLLARPVAPAKEGK
jgi:serine/threonine protein phosphatase PrpC